MKKFLFIVTISLVSVSSIESKAYDLNYSLHGSSASFLMLDDRWMTLNYLHPDANKVGLRNAAKANGDTHIYLYTRNGGDNGGGFNLSSISPQPDWEARLDELNNMGLKPVLWLTPDDSPSIVNQSMDAQKAHFTNMVNRFDSRVTGYVTCLECDEYWSAAQVQTLVAHLKSQTNKPVGVHLTPGIKPEYFVNADYVFLQTGFDKTPEEVKALVARAIAVTGKPVVASEYHLESRSATAKALGDAACAAGAIGTGNGRSINLCGSQPIPPSSSSSSSVTDTIMIVGGIAVVAAVAWYLHTNYEFRWIWEAEFTDNYQTIDFGRSFTLMPEDSKGRSLNLEMTLGTTTRGFSFGDNGREQDRVTFGFRGTF